MTTDKAAAPVGAVPQGDGWHMHAGPYTVGASNEGGTWSVVVSEGQKICAIVDDAALASQAARMGELEANDARYRWLRSQGTREAEIDRAIYETISDDHSPPYRSMKHGESLDAAIDKLRGEAG